MFGLYAPHTDAPSLEHQPRGPCMASNGLKEEPSIHVPTAHHPFAQQLQHQLQHHNGIRSTTTWMQFDQAAVARYVLPNTKQVTTRVIRESV